MRERGLALSPMMVRATVRAVSPKTMTRRILKLPHGLWENTPDGKLVPIPAGCPYGDPGEE